MAKIMRGRVLTGLDQQRGYTIINETVDPAVS
jgi:hypothetical protein